MSFSFSRFLAISCALFTSVYCVANTDEYRDADIGQSSYYDNHNMDPAVVDSNQFGILWKQPFLQKEQFYAKPLLFTPNGGNQLIFLASSMNYIRTLDAVTGNLINSRQVQTPFLQSDIGCTDIPNYIGIIGTPTIDPATEIAYFYAKTYIPNYRAPGNTGVINGVYYFYAVHISDLTDVPGYPVLVDGSVADNDPRKYFIGGTILQRPSLLQVGNMVYAGFGGHCDLYNYTGTVLGFDLTQKAVTTNFAVESGPNSHFTTTWSQNGGGGQGGIWMAGMGLASDGNRLFFSTGNGATGENQGTPASGQSGCRTLGETVTNLGIDPGTGKLSLVDYFQPYDYVNMDGGDQDFGSGGVALLDPGTFNGTGVARMAITTGKNGKIYFMNADNLGGYKQGAGQTDLVVQTIITNEAVFGGVGTYPLEGGYIYSTPVGYPTSVYKFGRTPAGVPSFSYVGKTTESSAGRVGPGVPTITTNKGRPGTAIMWTTDPDAGLRAWYAVPNPDGSMTRIQLAQTAGSNKFQRPAFGDGKLYTTDANGVLYCLGAPVNLPLNCSSPVDFGSVTLGHSATEKINCTALIGITAINSITTGDLNFVVDTSTVPKGAIAQGASFSFAVTWNLTGVTVSPAANASYGNTTPGIKSTALTIATTNAIQGYTNSFPLSLTGTEVSNSAFLSVTPQTVDFGGLVLGLEGEVPTSSLSFTIANLGQSAMQILGYGYTLDVPDDDDDDEETDLTNSTYSADTQSWDLGLGLTTSYLPAINSTLAAGQSASISALFNATNGTGSYLSYFNVWSSGGTAEIILEGSASTKPIANFSISNGEGGWLPGSNLLMDFGIAAPGQTVTRQIRICNEGGSVLTITKSKPPLGDIRAQNYGIDLHESQQVAVGACAYGTVVFNPSLEPPNVPDYTETNQWTLNVDDTDFGVHVVQMTGVSHDVVVGPTYPNGSAIFNYLGCYKDNGLDGTGVRLLPNEPYVDIANNTNGECQKACQAKGYVFAGTEYQQECWCGNNLPNGMYYSPQSNGACTFSCPGDPNQACGGNGGYASIYFDTTKYAINNATYSSSSSSSGPIGGPQTVNASGPYQYMGCYSEATNGRALTGLTPPAASAGGSVEYCEAQCAAGSFQYFGVEYSNECYCGNVINAGSVLQTGDSVSAGCNMVCGGNSSEYCGGPNRLNMYMLNGTIPATSSTAGTGGPTTTTGPAGPTQTSLSCPASNNTIYNSTLGHQYIIECGIDHAGGDIKGVAANSLEQCIASCDAQAGCVDVSLSGAACYMKSSVGAPVQNGVLGARLLQSSSTTTSTSVSAAPTNGTSSASNSGTVSTTASTTSVSSTPSPTQTPLSCPASNNTIYTASNGGQFLIECSIDHQGGDMSSLGVNTMEQCINACDSASGCVDVSLSGAACYLKKTLGAALNAPGIFGAKKVFNTTSSASSSTVSSTGSVTSSSATVSIATSSVGSTSVSSSSGNSTSTSLTASVSSTPASTSSSASSGSGSVSVSSTSLVTTSSAPASTSSVSSTSSSIATSTAISSSASGSSNPASTSSASSNSVSSVSSASGSVSSSVVSTSSGSISSVSSSSSSTATSINSTQSSSSAPASTSSTSSSSSAAVSTNSSSSSSLVSTSSAASTSSAPTSLASTSLASTSPVSSNPASTSSVSSSSTSTSSSSSGPASTSSTSSSPASTSSASSSSVPTGSVSSSPVSTSSTTSKPVSTSSVSSSPASTSSASTSAASTSSVATTSASPTSSSSSSSAVTSSSSVVSSSSPSSSSPATTFTSSVTTSSSTSSAASSTTSTAKPSTTSSASLSTSSASSSTSVKSASTTSSAPIKPTAPPMIGNYTYQGCFNDSTSARALKGGGFQGSSSNNMTLEKCGTYCSKYSFFGVEYGQECYCGNTLLNNSKNQTLSSCSTPCPGNSTEQCGAGSRLNLYYFNATAAAATTTTSSAPASAPTTAASHRRARRGRRV